MTASHPAQLHLPGGIVADLIPGTRPPRYAGSDVDVTIPDDLAPLWHWHGSFLSDGQVGIATVTYGVPGVFEQARIHMRLRAEYQPRLVQLSLFEVAA